MGWRDGADEAGSSSGGSALERSRERISLAAAGYAAEEHFFEVGASQHPHPRHPLRVLRGHCAQCLYLRIVKTCPTCHPADEEVN